MILAALVQMMRAAFFIGEMEQELTTGSEKTLSDCQEGEGLSMHDSPCIGRGSGIRTRDSGASFQYPQRIDKSPCIRPGYAIPRNQASPSEQYDGPSKMPGRPLADLNRSYWYIAKRSVLPQTYVLPFACSSIIH